jgi:hypothetical protein
VALEQLAQEALGRTLIAFLCDQDVKRVAVLIDRSPQIVPFAADRKEYLIEVPVVPRLCPATL